MLILHTKTENFTLPPPQKNATNFTFGIFGRNNHTKEKFCGILEGLIVDFKSWAKLVGVQIVSMHTH